MDCKYVLGKINGLLKNLLSVTDPSLRQRYQREVDVAQQRVQTVLGGLQELIDNINYVQPIMEKALISDYSGPLAPAL